MIGDKIHTLRIQKELTLEQLGKAAKVGKSTMQKYETGEVKNIPYDRIVRIAKALNVHPGTLMGWDDEPTEPELKDKSVDELIEFFGTRPEGRILFSVAKDCTAEEILQAVKIIEALKK